MGIFDFFSGPMTQEKFSQIVLAELRKLDPASQYQRPAGVSECLEFELFFLIKGHSASTSLDADGREI